MMLPAGWESAELEALSAKIGSGATPRGGRAGYASSGVPLIRSMNVHFAGFKQDGLAFLDEDQARLLDGVKVEANDVLLNITGASIGRVCLAPVGLSGARVNQHVCIIRLVDGIASRYVQAFLASPEMQRVIVEENYGLTRQALTKEMVQGFKIPIPPRAEQRRIVAKLDALTVRLTHARVELKRVDLCVKLLREQVKSDAFDGELTRKWRGDIDSDWSEVALSEIADVVTGSTPPTAEKANLFGGAHPFFKPTDLDAGYHVIASRETLSDEGLTRARSAPAGSTLVTCIGATIAKTGFARVACAFNQQINAAIPKSGRVAADWLFWALSSPQFRQRIISNSSATTLPIINKGRFQALKLHLPNLSEQREIVRRIEAAFARADLLEAEAARARALLDRLEASILAKVFRGELVPQDPNDEPAQVLLDRIRAEREAQPKVKRGRKAA